VVQVSRTYDNNHPWQGHATTTIHLLLFPTRLALSTEYAAMRNSENRRDKAPCPCAIQRGPSSTGTMSRRAVLARRTPPAKCRVGITSIFTKYWSLREILARNRCSGT